MSNVPMSRFSHELGRASGWLIFLGLILLIGGIAMFVVPLVGGLVVTTWVAAIFIVAGVFQVIHAFQVRGWKAGLWHTISGLVYIIGGLLAFFNPLAGAVALTFVLGLTFIIDGVVRIILALGSRPRDHWGWILFGGIISLLVGLYILVAVTSAPASLMILGIFAGISFIFEGIAFLMLGMGARSLR